MNMFNITEYQEKVNHIHNEMPLPFKIVIMQKSEIKAANSACSPVFSTAPPLHPVLLAFSF